MVSPEIAAIWRRILIIRGQRVMLDFELAAMYGVETRALNQAVRRNLNRFPPDFMFRLTSDEIRRLSQFVITSGRGKNQIFSPRMTVFTEHGVAMLSSVLRSPKAVQVNIQIFRAFTRLRRMILEDAKLAKRLDEIESRYNGKFREVFEAIRELAEPPRGLRRRIGFSPHADHE